MENEVVKIIKDYELKSGISLPKPYLAISGRSERDHPASAFRKQVIPVLGGFTYKPGLVSQAGV